MLTVAAPQPTTSLRSAIASLPDRLRLVSKGTADLVAIDGSSEWSDRLIAAINRGARGIMIIDPHPDACLDVPAVDVPAVVDSAWGWNPAVLETATALADLDSMSSVDVSVVVATDVDLASTLLHEIMLLRSAGLALDDLSMIRLSARGLDATGWRHDGTRVSISVVQTNAVPPAASIRAISEQRTIELAIPDAATAQPATLHITDADGDRLRPTHFETAHRAAWRALHDLVVTESGSDALTNLAQDAAIVTRCLGS